jgi:hypothetical protein
VPRYGGHTRVIDGKEELLGIAQIAVTLIGFSGLIFAFRARTVDELEARDFSALAMIVGSGSVALAFALLPLPIAYLELGADTVWRLSTGLFGMGLLVAAGVFVRTNSRLHAAGHVARTPRLNKTTLALAIAMALLLALSAFDVGFAAPATYLFALIVCVLLCIVFVVFMLIVVRRTP